MIGQMDGSVFYELTSGLACFSDPQWAEYPARCYRLRSP